MVRLLSGIGSVALLLLVFLAYPYVTIWQLNQAVTAQDETALASLVDWESVAAGLSTDLEGLFDQPDAGSQDPMDALAENLIGIFTDFLIDPIVSFYTTPEGLTYLLNAQVILDDPGEALEADFPAEDTWFDHIASAGFVGLTRFDATVHQPVEGDTPQTDAEPMTLEFTLQGFRWQLTRVRLPLDDLAAETDQTEQLKQ